MHWIIAEIRIIDLSKQAMSEKDTDTEINVMFANKQIEKIQFQKILIWLVEQSIEYFHPQIYKFLNKA